MQTKVIKPLLASMYLSFCLLSYKEHGKLVLHNLYTLNTAYYKR